MAHHPQLQLQYPDGSVRVLDPRAQLTLGRGSVAALQDEEFLSREHVALAPLSGEGLRVSITNLGRNPIVVQALAQQQQDGQQQQQQQSWRQVWVLKTGDDCLCGPNSRFFVAAREETTAFVLLLAAAGGPEGGTSNGGSGSGVQPAGAQQPSAAAAARAAQEAADAALAAALAAEEEEAVNRAAVAVAAADDDDDDGGPPEAKRTRLLNEAVVASNDGPVPHPPPLGDTPYALLSVNHPCFNAGWNRGCLGASLAQLVAGSIRTALVMNYRYDYGFFPLACCPGLLAADQVMLVEGDAKRQKGPNGYGWQRLHAATVAMADGAFTRAAEALGVPGPSELAVHSPETESWGTHHTKAFVLGYHDGGVRVIVHTANLLHHDCNSKTQGVWWQDFPPKPAGEGGPSPLQQQQQRQAGGRGGSSGSGSGSGSSEPQRPSDFGGTLAAYIAALQLPGAWGPRMQAVVAGADFSAARGVLIGSVPGRHEGAMRDRWGHMALRAALNAASLPARFRPPVPAASGAGAAAAAAASAEVVMQASSLGTVNTPWLEELQDSLAAGNYTEGDDGDDNEQPAAAAAAPQTQPSASSSSSRAQPPQQWVRRPRLHFVWPTADEVRRSVEGWSAGGSIPARSDKAAAQCLQTLWRKWDGSPVGRQAAMPHIKTYTRFLPAALPAQPTPRHAAGAAAERRAAAAAAAGGGSSSTSGSGMAVSGPAAAAAGGDAGGAGGAGGATSAQWAYELPWALLTSANLSKPAWGSLERSGKLFIRSFELGVLALPQLEARYRAHPHRHYTCTPDARPGVVPELTQQPPAAAGAGGGGSVRFFAWNQAAPAPAPAPAADGQPPGQQQQDLAGGGSSSQAVFVPVCFPLPPRRYDMQAGDRYWTVDEDYPGTDCFRQRCPNVANNYRN